MLTRLPHKICLNPLIKCVFRPHSQGTRAPMFGDRPRTYPQTFSFLLEYTLDSGRSKTYGHAARYYKNLVQLDTVIANYRSFPYQASFETTLRERHGRKSPFWRQAK
jgi:hypothetical protein